VRLALVITALALVAAGGVQAAAPPNVRGTVIAPFSVSCPPGDPCDPHPVGVFVVFSRAHHTAVRVLVRQGRFATRLAPGRWVVSLAPPPLNGIVVPRTVLVPRARSVTLQVAVKRVTA
jgi:hypothetical protein